MSLHHLCLHLLYLFLFLGTTRSLLWEMPSSMVWGTVKIYPVFRKSLFFVSIYIYIVLCNGIYHWIPLKPIWRSVKWFWLKNGKIAPGNQIVLFSLTWDSYWNASATNVHIMPTHSIGLVWFHLTFSFLKFECEWKGERSENEYVDCLSISSIVPILWSRVNFMWKWISWQTNKFQIHNLYLRSNKYRRAFQTLQCHEFKMFPTFKNDVMVGRRAFFCSIHSLCSFKSQKVAFIN